MSTPAAGVLASPIVWVRSDTRCKPQLVFQAALQPPDQSVGTGPNFSDPDGDNFIPTLWFFTHTPGFESLKSVYLNVNERFGNANNRRERFLRCIPKDQKIRPSKVHWANTSWDDPSVRLNNPVLVEIGILIDQRVALKDKDVESDLERLRAFKVVATDYANKHLAAAKTIADAAPLQAELLCAVTDSIKKALGTIPLHALIQLFRV